MPDKKTDNKAEFEKLRDDAREHFAKAVDCLARAYLTPFIQERLDSKKKLDQKEIIKKVDIASRMIYVDTLKAYFGVKEDGDGKSKKTVKVKSDKSPSRKGK